MPAASGVQWMAEEADASLGGGCGNLGVAASHCSQDSGPGWLASGSISSRTASILARSMGIGYARRAVEHQLCDIVLYAKSPSSVGREVAGDDKDHIRCIAYAPVVGLVEFYGDVVGRHTRPFNLVGADRPPPGRVAAPIHLVEPEERHGCPGQANGVQVQLGQANEVVGARGKVRSSGKLPWRLAV